MIIFGETSWSIMEIFVWQQVLAATQTPGETGKKWFQGTADAVRQFTWVFEVSVRLWIFRYQFVVPLWKWLSWVLMILIGCQEQEHRARTDFVRWSSLQNGLHGLCPGIYSKIRSSSTLKISLIYYWAMWLQKHVDSQADITVSCVPMDDRYVIICSFIIVPFIQY